MTQDGNQRIGGNGIASNWMFTKYDKLGRVVYTGLFTSPLSRKQLQQRYFDNQIASSVYEVRSVTGFTNGGKVVRYSNNNFPSNPADIEVLSVSYYDDATQAAGSNITYETDVILSNNLAYTNVYSPILSTSNTGLPTISETRVLGTNDWITNASYYDTKGRAVYVAMVNDYLGTWDKSWSNIDFIGKATETKTEHHKQSLSQTITTTDYLTYDHMDRLITHEQMIGSQPLERIVNNTYDAMGQLESKGVGGTATASQSLQTVDYNYNVRGWLTNINDQNNLGNDLFGFDINYNAPALGSGSEALYNGNISETLWKTANDGITRGYQYGYDALNRIKYATYRGGTQHQASGMLENYSVNNVNYDKNGNITTLNRMGLFENASNSTMSMDYVDKLTYQYSPKSNQLINVRDIADVAANNTFNGGFKDKFAGNNYIYGDANGNMTQDNNKNIQSISYNHLNLPTQIEFTGDRTIVYTYDASGVKLKKEIFLTVRDLFNPVADLTSIYAGNYIYEKDNSGEKLSFFSHPEGYVEKNGAGYDYVYQYKDHLGNVRLSYKNTSNTGVNLQIVEENNYYPFGLQHKGYNNIVQNSNSAASKFKYNGKELKKELGLDWYDYGARNYDASLGRWMNIDNLASTYYAYSPYNYAANNPVLFYDPDGNYIDISHLNAVHKKAFKRFLGTKEGKRFVLLYGSAGQNIMGFKVQKDGKYSKHMVAYYTTKMNESDSKGGSSEVQMYNRKTKKPMKLNQVSQGNMSSQLFFQVLIGDGENEIEATETIGHEGLVHVEANTYTFEELIEDYSNGNLAEKAKNKDLNMFDVFTLALVHLNSTDADDQHRLFVDGKNVSYEEFIKELGTLFDEQAKEGKKNAEKSAERSRNRNEE